MMRQQTAMSAKSPNILLIMADQLAPQFMPCYGHPLVRAPALQRLAEEGVVEGIVESARPLGSGELAELTVAFGAQLGKEVRLQNKISEDLIAGVRVIVDNKMVDSSVAGRFDDAHVRTRAPWWRRAPLEGVARVARRSASPHLRLHRTHRHAEVLPRSACAGSAGLS